MQTCTFRVAFGTHFRVSFTDGSIVQVDLYASERQAQDGRADGLIAEDCDLLQMSQEQRDLLHYALEREVAA